MTSVILIVGASRSGSTLIDRILGEAESAASLGEVNQLWRRGVLENQLCGCGQPFRACPRWAHILAPLRADDLEAYGQRVEELRREVVRNRRLPFVFVPWLSRNWHTSRRAFAAEVCRLYEAAAHGFGVETVIDSSKHPVFAHMLVGTPGIDLQILHLVRDSRAVAHSAMRIRRKPDVHDRQVDMVRLAPAKSGRAWLRVNLLCELLRPRVTSYVRVRYEDLVENPGSQFGQLSKALALDLGPTVVESSVASLSVSHTASGNPMRFTVGQVRIEPDIAWRTSMSRRARGVVSAITWPLLLRYGYLRVGRRARP